MHLSPELFPSDLLPHAEPLHPMHLSPELFHSDLLPHAESLHPMHLLPELFHSDLLLDVRFSRYCLPSDVHVVYLDSLVLPEWMALMESTECLVFPQV